MSMNGFSEEEKARMKECLTSLREALSESELQRKLRMERTKILKLVDSILWDGVSKPAFCEFCGQELPCGTEKGDEDAAKE